MLDLLDLIRRSVVFVRTCALARCVLFYACVLCTCVCVSCVYVFDVCICRLVRLCARLAAFVRVFELFGLLDVLVRFLLCTCVVAWFVLVIGLRCSRVYVIALFICSLC